MRWKKALRWIAYSVGGCALAVVLYFCAFSLYTSYVTPYAAVFTPGGAAQDGEPRARSGFRLLTDNDDALMSRVVLADRAQRTLDLQYYIFDADATGTFIAQRLLAAADRGVRVRLLVDDLDAGNADDLLGGLDAHRNIEVRRFNPFRTRDPSIVSKIVQFVLDGRRLNRRMHNKSFIVDDSVAIVGGRNIGDSYFEEGPTAHFRDLDLILTGAVVKQATRAFEAYWQAPAAQPLANARTEDDIEALRNRLASQARPGSRSDYAQALGEDFARGTNAATPGPWLWGSASIVADEPDKVDADLESGVPTIGPRIDALIAGAHSEVLLISAYFVPGDEDAAFLAGLARRGIKVRVLTNSLAATDEPMVHAGYASYRRTLLEGGVELYELRPALGAQQQPSAHGKSSGVSLHAKAIVVDRKRVFIGSMNLDLRSRLLNTEMGVIADSAELGAAAGDYFDRAAKPAHSFRVVLDRDGDMAWRAADDAGDPILFTHEPEVSIWRRARVDLLRMLPVDHLL
jgi:putative cardiolipin synthase